MTTLAAGLVAAGVADEETPATEENFDVEDFNAPRKRFIALVEFDKVRVDRNQKPIGFGTVVEYVGVDTRGDTNDGEGHPIEGESVFIIPFTTGGMDRQDVTPVPGMIIRVSVSRQSAGKDNTTDWISGYYHAVVSRPKAETIAADKISGFTNSVEAMADAALAAWTEVDTKQADKESREAAQAILAGLLNDDVDKVKSATGALSARVEAIKAKTIIPEMRRQAFAASASTLAAKYGLTLPKK